MAANVFKPYDLKIKDIVGNTIIVCWEMDNTVEFKKGVYYNVYTSDDGTTFNFLAIANTKMFNIPMRAVPYYVAVTSVLPTSGESDKADALFITKTIGTMDSQDSTAIAITPSGEPIRLKTLADGTVVVALNGASIGGGSGISTEAKQDSLLAALNLIKDGNHADLSSLLVAISGLNETMNTASMEKLLLSEATASGVTPSSALIALPWKKKSLVHKITVIKESGSASQWLVEILNTNVTPEEKNIVLRDASVNYSGMRMDLLQTVPFINVLDLDFIYVRLTPDAGSDNVFYLNISGEESK